MKVIFCYVILGISGTLGKNHSKNNCIDQEKPGNHLQPENVSQKELEKHLQPDDVGRNRKYDDLNNVDPILCTRNCTKYPERRLCYYQFNVEEYSAMGEACGNCSRENATDCYQRQCIQADGIERKVVSINRMIPGPSIDVCFADKIVVDVINRMSASTLTIHWHGMLQKKTPWMDGVPFVTQCPINPNSRFRYNFQADTNGTLLYHAHIAHAFQNGVYGTLNVRTPESYDPNCKIHNYDLPSHTVHVSDWTHFPAEIYNPGYYRNASHYPIKPDGYLINGRGSYEDSVTATDVPHSEFHVQCGKKYRIRIIASVTSTCGFKFSVEDHILQVIALDGYPCKPTNVSTLVMSSGQRTDVVLFPKKGVTCQNTYLMVVKGIDDACETTTNAQTAYLIYDGAPCRPSTRSQAGLKLIHETTPFMNNYQLNCSADNICEHQMESIREFDASISKDVDKITCTHHFTINTTTYRYNSSEFFETNLYQSFYTPNGPRGSFVAALNSVSAMFPPAPLLTQERDLPADFPICQRGQCEKTGNDFCRCLNILPVQLNSSVEIEFVGDRPHPVHIHGHRFTIVSENATTEKAYKVRRDVIHIVPGVQRKVRFTANNAGYWIMHCHFNLHFEGGMFLVFKVGETSQFKRAPKNFPKCGDYLPPVRNF